MVELRDFGKTRFLRTASKRRKKKKTVRCEKASCLTVFLCTEGDRFRTWMVEKVAVLSDNRLIFTFFNGQEITA